MIRVIEDLGEVVIQKVVRPKDGSLLRYQTVAKADLGNTEKVKVTTSLQAAREAATVWLTMKKVFPS